MFKLKALVLPARGEVTLAKRVSLAEMSTRVHRLGDHRVDVRVNGKDFPGGAFRVVEASGAASPGQAAPRPPRSLVRRAR